MGQKENVGCQKKRNESRSLSEMEATAESASGPDGGPSRPSALLHLDSPAVQGLAAPIVQ